MQIYILKRQLVLVTAIRRYRVLFGVDAVREADGRSYSDLLSEKRSTKK